MDEMLVEVKLLNNPQVNSDIIEDLVQYDSGDWLYQSHDTVLMWEQDYQDYKERLSCHSVANFSNDQTIPGFTGVKEQTILIGDCDD